MRFFCSQNSKHEARHKICQATIILIHGFKTYRTMKMGVTAEHDGGDDRNMLVKELTDYDVKTYGAEVEE